LAGIIVPTMTMTCNGFVFLWYDK